MEIPTSGAGKHRVHRICSRSCEFTNRFKRADLFQRFSLILNHCAAIGSLCIGLFAFSMDVGAVTSPVGVTSGSFAVSSNGAATYSIPIFIPPGTNGMQPQLTLSYNSQGGNGLLGMGWSLSGLSVIHRCGATIAIDGFKGGVNYDANDKFCLDGERLIWDATNGFYRTQHESWQKISVVGSYFTVTAKDGTVMTYGGTSDSQIMPKGNASMIRLWALNRIQDRNSNYLTITYQNNGLTAGEYYPTSIAYTGNGSVVPYNFVYFDYQGAARADVIQAYEGGSLISTTQLLTGIRSCTDSACAQGFTLVRKYVLAYANTGTVGQSRLTSVQECGSDGVCLPVTTFGWQEKDIVFALGPVDSGNNAVGLGADWTGDNVNAYVADFNGDGKSDVLRQAKGAWSGSAYRQIEIYLSNDDGTFTKSNSDTNGNTIGLGADWNGDNVNVYVADFNGDGSTDIARQTKGAWGGGNYRIMEVYLSNDDGTFTKSGSDANGNALGLGADWTGDNVNVYVGDFNGDGLSDLVRHEKSGWGADGYYRQIEVYLSDGDGTFTKTSSDANGNALGLGPDWNGDYVNVHVGDFNGDGKSDILRQEKSSWATDNTRVVEIYLGNNDGSFSRGPVDANQNAIGLGYDWTGDYLNIYLADFNGDGKTDIARQTKGAWGSGSYRIMEVYLGKGDGSFAKAPGDAGGNALGLGSEWNGDYVNLYLGDFNGDGKTDIARQEMGTWGGDSMRQMQVYFPARYISDLLTGVTNGFGVQSTVTYKPITDGAVYTRDSSAAYPYQDVQNAIYVVSQSTQSDGNGGVNTTTHQYGGLKKHHKADASLGFRWIQVTDPADLVTTTTYNQSANTGDYLDGTEGTVLSNVTRANGVKIKETTDNWVSVPLQYNASSLPIRTLARLNSSEEKSWDLNGTLLPTMTISYSLHDSYNNPGKIEVGYTDGWSKTTENIYNNDTVNWILGRLTYAKVTATAPGQGTEYRESSFTYDSLGRLATEAIEPNRPTLTLTTTYGYDSFGNRTSKTLSGTGIVSRTESQTFTANGQFPLTTTNALGHSESYVYDARYGTVTSQTGPNNLTTTWSYDGFGRKVVEIRPDGTSTVVNYKCWAGNEPVPPNTCPMGQGYATETLASGAGAVWAYFDIFGRPVRSARISYDGVWVYSDTSYDALGRQVSVSQPDFNSTPTYYTTYTHDALGRVLTATAPGNRVTTTAYNGLTTTVTNPKNQTHTTVKNSQGHVASATDAGGTTSYVYDPFGNLKSVTGVDGVVTSMTYDIRGRKTAMNDPDMGAWSYAYNVLGELVSQTDAKNQTITMAYDKLGRMTSRALPAGEGTSTWTYGTVVPEIGKLKTVSNPNANESYTYDSLGRPITHTTTVGGVNYTVTTAYDTLGRVNTITYPETGFRLKHVYDPNQFGFLKEVKNDSTGASYWKINTGGVDALNRIINETYGNNLISQRQYAGGTGDLNFIKTGTAGNPTSVQNETYGFDQLGNVTARGWWDGTAQRNETFGYDNLNRLTTVTGPANKTYAYAPNGNITSKTSVGTYTYPTNGIRPHAVTSIAGTINTSFTYDANGNMLTGNGRTLTYTTFNKVKTVTQGTTTDTFTYDADFNRLTKVVGTSATTYIGKLYERNVNGSTTTQRHFIYAGPNLVGAYTKINTATNTRYFHTDHLGSVAVITNETGAVLQRLSYDAWGKRRNANGTDAASITAQTTRGFTRHEHDDEVGLINMNAREFDPLLGRFVTPDTIVQFPYSSQGMNRFTYVNNNPLSFTDPSGHSLRKKIKKAVQKVAHAHKQYIDWHKRVADRYGRQIAAVGVTFVPGLNVYAAGFLSGMIASGGDFRAGLIGAFSAGILSGPIHNMNPGMAKVLTHGMVGGARSELMGSDFKSGFMSGGFTQAVSWSGMFDGLGDPSALSGRAANAFGAAAVGGLASVVGGGRFADGALTGAFSRMFNDLYIARYKGGMFNPFGHVGSGVVGQNTVGLYPKNGLSSLGLGPVEGELLYDKGIPEDIIIIRTTPEQDQAYLNSLESARSNEKLMYDLNANQAQNCVRIISDSLKSVWIDAPNSITPRGFMEDLRKMYNGQ